jgi:hypothetical protein
MRVHLLYKHVANPLTLDKYAVCVCQITKVYLISAPDGGKSSAWSLYSGEKTTTPTGYKAGRAVNVIWMLWKTEKDVP